MSDFFTVSVRDLIYGVAAVGGLFYYLDTRKRELAWKRTEFLFEVAEKVDADPDMQRATRVLAGTDQIATVGDLFGPAGLRKGCDVHLASFDKLLNLLDRIAYGVLQVESLSMQEVANFGWFYRRIASHPCLARYCESNGYPDVVRLAPKIQAYMAENYNSYEISRLPECPHYGACAAQQCAAPEMA